MTTSLPFNRLMSITLTAANSLVVTFFARTTLKNRTSPFHAEKKSLVVDILAIGTFTQCFCKLPHDRKWQVKLREREQIKRRRRRRRIYLSSIQFFVVGQFCLASFWLVEHVRRSTILRNEYFYSQKTSKTSVRNNSLQRRSSRQNNESERFGWITSIRLWTKRERERERFYFYASCCSSIKIRRCFRTEALLFLERMVRMLDIRIEFMSC